MPGTKLQDWIFTLITVFCMVYCMTLYNMTLENGLTLPRFADALAGMWPEAAAALLAQRYVAGPTVRKKVSRLFASGPVPPILPVAATAGLTVTWMAPMMTLFVSVLHHGISPALPAFWLPKLVANFPFALCLRLFYIGPLVRFLFRTLFRNSMPAAPQEDRKTV